MKKLVFSSVVCFCLLTLGTATNAFAQLPGTMIRATIPFEFNVRGKTLPAGLYQLSAMNDSNTTLEISKTGRHAHVAAGIITDPVQLKRIASKNVLVFHRYGDTYFLEEIIDAGEQTALQVPVSRQERRIERELASNSSPTEPETVTLAAY